VRLNAGLPPAAASASDAAGQDATALAKKLQNPIGDLYSVPFQFNTNLRAGPGRGTQEMLNIQPVIPVHLNEDWNLKAWMGSTHFLTRTKNAVAFFHGLGRLPR
jgi:hypothetical protein